MARHSPSCHESVGSIPASHVGAEALGIGLLVQVHGMKRVPISCVPGGALTTNHPSGKFTCHSGSYRRFFSCGNSCKFKLVLRAVGKGQAVADPWLKQGAPGTTGSWSILGQESGRASR